MADPGSVPAGKYGKASLEALGVWGSVAGRIMPTRDVREALQVVSDGDAPLGIVYQTDAAADKRVKIVGAFPDRTHPPIVARGRGKLNQQRGRSLPPVLEVLGCRPGI